jgi:hypothetical protein
MVRKIHYRLEQAWYNWITTQRNGSSPYWDLPMAGVMHDNLTRCIMANLKKYLNIHDPLQIQVPSELTLFLIHHQRKVIGALSAVGTSIGRISLCAPWE